MFAALSLPNFQLILLEDLIIAKVQQFLLLTPQKITHSASKSYFKEVSLFKHLR
jgi:hypothetical protein